MSKDSLIRTLREILRDVMKARFDGGSYAKLARANGYADGYMRALLDAGIMDQREMLTFVGNERQKFVDETPSYATTAA